MKQILDLHIHSKYSRACSRDLTLANIDAACRIKGVDIIATGDFTYPSWFDEIKNELEEAPTPAYGHPSKEGNKESGLYKLKAAEDDKVKFILSTELALIYKSGDRARRIHLMVHAPNLEAVSELNNYLDKKYNIRSDGRPILGMSAVELFRLCLSIHPQFLIYPAHIWTPWFSVFGSKSGFDRLEECFGEYTEQVYALETGLSSDPEMNWRVSALDRLTIISNSDAHSLVNIAREANVFELAEISYRAIYNVIKNKKIFVEQSVINKSATKELSFRAPARKPLKMNEAKNKGFLPEPVLSVAEGVEMTNGIVSTIEFYPEEGMYHFDGHRDCGVVMNPAESKKKKGVCPVCKKPLTVGVAARVEELADRPEDYKPERAAPFYKLIELDKIIAEALGIKSRHSKQVKAEYDSLVRKLGSELKILLDTDLNDIKKAAIPEIADGIRRVRAGELSIKPGFDGQYGQISIFRPDEIAVSRQNKLF